MKRRERCSKSRSNGRATAHRKLPKRIEFGAMLEVPSLAEMLDLLLPRVDFLSIGTNDLTQFLFAADRSDPRLAQRYDWLSPAILRFLKRVLDQCAAAGVTGPGLRGDGGPAAGGDGAGRHRRGRISPSRQRASVRSRRWSVRSTPAPSARRMDQLLAKPPKDMRKALTDWARKHKVTIG